MRPDGLSAVSYARWTRSGYSWSSTGWNRPITVPNARDALGCSGVNAPMGRRVSRAIAGWNVSARCRRQVASRPSRRIPFSSMPSPIGSWGNHLIWLGCVSNSCLLPPVIAYGGVSREVCAGEGHHATGLPVSMCLLSHGAKGAFLRTRAAPNTAPDCLQRPLRFRFRQQVSASVRQRKGNENAYRLL
jgi:hypothetical protein